jgi:hypothetical protein
MKTETTAMPACIFDSAHYQDQFQFQAKYAIGKVLNVGCDSDGAHLGSRPGAVNVDLHLTSQIRQGWKSPVHVLADARQLPFKASFDTVVLGEILEHMSNQDVYQTLREAMGALRFDGRFEAPQIVITVPHDTREPEAQGYGEVRFFAPGIPVYHPRYVSREMLMGWIDKAGLRPILMADIHYVWGQWGTGLVVEVRA